MKYKSPNVCPLVEFPVAPEKPAPGPDAAAVTPFALSLLLFQIYTVYSDQ